MRFTHAAGLGAAWGLLTGLPIALLAWLAGDVGALQALGFHGDIAREVHLTAANGWPLLRDRAPWPIAGVRDLVLVPALVGALGAMVFWALHHFLPTDPGGLAWRSLVWTLRNALDRRFLLLLLAGWLAFFGIWELGKALSVPAASLPALVLVELVMLLQVTQMATVQGARIGRWWPLRRLTWRHFAALVVVMLLAAVGAEWFETLTQLLWTAATAHILVRPELPRSTREFWAQVRTVNPLRWAAQWVWLAVLFAPLVAVVVAATGFNIFLAPVIVDTLSQQQSLSLPMWWSWWSQLSNWVTGYWWAVAIALWLPLVTLMSARLAWQEVAYANEQAPVV